MRARLLVCLLLAGCSVGPDYVRPPPSSLPIAYKELQGWAPANPRDMDDRGAWWSVYGDPLLDQLAPQVAVSNQTLIADEALFRQNVAIVAQARAQLFPTIGAAASAQRRHGTTGSGTGFSSSTFDTGTSTTAGTTTTSPGTSSSFVSTGSGRATNAYALEGTASWELDLWGRIRRQVESDVAAAQASAADLANARLSLQSQLVTDYMLLRSADELKLLLDRTVADYQRAVQITQNQYNAGVAARGDVISAETQLAGAQSAAINVGVQRSQLEHAIAVLTGKAPAELTIAPGHLPQAVPLVPPGVPSTLLERRPDIASAERNMQEQNAKIGVAVAAFYPQVTLSGVLGLAGSSLGGLFSVANNVWSLGSSAAMTLFDAGARSAAVRQARAEYDQAVATYRQTVLTAFQQVEDELSATRILQAQSAAAQRAVELARRSVAIALNQYRAGTQPFTTVITAQNTALADEQSALTVRQNLLTASVSLIVALGGGWQETALPAPAAIKAQPIFP
ncbi:MAG: efflux transporter outer membrane subunit [Acetobacteraceae bacterium]|nr:efflux transporter outer membrane subunit [Acetobacteraceae bacterium]